MPNIKSAIKRVQISERNRLRNKAYKSAVRTLMKSCFVAVENYTADPTPENMGEVNRYKSAAFSKIDKAVKRKVLHRNNAARKKARLSRVVKQVEVVAAN